MKTLAWKDLQHKSSPERLAAIDREALAELDRMGFAALRKARRQTQVEIAEKLGIDQASVSAIENRSDLLLSTLRKYVRALGGEVEIRAVFPEASFNLEPILAVGLASNPNSKAKQLTQSAPLPSAVHPLPANEPPQRPPNRGVSTANLRPWLTGQGPQTSTEPEAPNQE